MAYESEGVYASNNTAHPTGVGQVIVPVDPCQDWTDIFTDLKQTATATLTQPLQGFEAKKAYAKKFSIGNRGTAVMLRMRYTGSTTSAELKVNLFGTDGRHRRKLNQEATKPMMLKDRVGATFDIDIPTATTDIQDEAGNIYTEEILIDARGCLEVFALVKQVPDCATGVLEAKVV